MLPNAAKTFTLQLKTQCMPQFLTNFDVTRIGNMEERPSKTDATTYSSTSDGETRVNSNEDVQIREVDVLCGKGKLPHNNGE